MAADSDCEREDDSPVPAVDLPARWYRGRREDDHHGDEQNANDKRNPEAFEDLGHLEPKVGALDFLLCRAPGDVVREEVRKEGLREMDGETTKEEEAMCKR